MADSNGRYRKIHVKIWNDDKFPYMTPAGKMVFLHILTTPLSTPFGCFKAGILSLADEANMRPESYAESFGESLRAGLLEFDEMVKVIKLKSFIKYNPPHNPNVLRSWGASFNELPVCQLKLNTYAEIRQFCAKKKKGFRESFKESFREPTLNDYPNQPLNTGAGTGAGTSYLARKDLYAGEIGASFNLSSVPATGDENSSENLSESKISFPSDDNNDGVHDDCPFK